jgi:hypothetical protein
MQFASVDIETTGIDPNKDAVLEIAAGCAQTIGEVKASGDFSIADVSRYIYAPLDNEIRILVIPDTPITADLYILAMHSRLWSEMSRFDKEMGKEKQVIKVSDSFFAVRKEKAWPIFHAWFRRVQPKGAMNCAGKNYAGFDARFLRRIDTGFDDLFRARVIDPAPLYYRSGDEKMPSTETCLERLKKEWPSMPALEAHNALDDARAVGWLVKAGLMRSGLTATGSSKVERSGDSEARPSAEKESNS